jgi:uncharacterized membrane protein YdjX (TVP38/TMEM64 family)
MDRHSTRHEQIVRPIMEEHRFTVGSRFVSSRAVKATIAGVWLAVIGGWTWYLRASGQSPVDWLQGLVDTASGAWWAIPAFVLAYLARPLLLFPASLLTIAAGILFGPVVGVPVALAAATASAFVAFQIGKTFSPAAVRDGDGATVIDRWSGRMRDESFLTVMLMRLAYLPYDLVNYAAGFLRINAGAFVAATALGSLPGTVSFVLAGASLKRLDPGLDGFDPMVFAASLAIFAVSIAISKVVQRRAVPA